MQGRSAEVTELENMVGIRENECHMCYLNECQVALLKNQRDAAELRTNRHIQMAKEQKEQCDRWRFWFYVAAVVLGMSILKWMN